MFSLSSNGNKILVTAVSSLIFSLKKLQRILKKHI